MPYYRFSEDPLNGGKLSYSEVPIESYTDTNKDQGESSMTEEQRKEIAQRRGDFIHGANWAQKKLREDGFLHEDDQVTPGEIAAAAVVRFPYPVVYREAKVNWGTITATASGVALTTNYSKEVLNLTRAQALALEFMSENNVNELTVEGLLIKRNTSYGSNYTSIKGWQLPKHNVDTVIDLAKNPTEESK